MVTLSAKRPRFSQVELDRAYAAVTGQPGASLALKLRLLWRVIWHKRKFLVSLLVLCLLLSRYLVLDVAVAFPALSGSASTKLLLEAEGFWSHTRLDPLDRFSERFHDGRPDGRMLLVEGEPHPIPALMRAAQKRWKALNARQSKSFAQACREYRRRFRRPPPKGFDQWYAFARLNDVRLIDEFDLVERSLRLFRAFTPANFRERVYAVSRRHSDHQWGIIVNQQGQVSRNGSAADHQRAWDAVDLIEAFAHHLPPLWAWFNAHDTAFLMIPWEERVRLQKIVDAGQYDKQDGPPYLPIARAPAPEWGGWQLCTPDSPMRAPGFTYGVPTRELTGREIPEPPEGAAGSVIGSWKLSLDPCYNPQMRLYHAGTTIYPHEPRPMLPFFAPGIHWHFPDIYTIIPEQFDFKPFLNPSWERRPFDRLVWRGQNSGLFWNKQSAYNSTQRARLHHLTHYTRGQQRLVGSDDKGRVKTVSEDRLLVSKAFFDTGMVGPPVQCSRDDGTCDELYDVFDGFDVPMNNDQANLYKYSLDVDGNSWSGRFRRLMLSDSVVLKATLYTEFWTDWVMPWLHFIPIQVDYSDLHDVMAFFRGGPGGIAGHDQLAKQIALAGKEWAEQHMRWADMQTYMFRLLLEYGRLYNGDWDFNGDESREPIWRPPGR